MSKKLFNNDELIQSLLESEKDQYDFCDIVDLSNGLSRHLHVGEVEANMADAIESYIRFFNRCDEEAEIPVEERTPIKIFVDSPGGDLVSAFTIIDSIRLSKTPVWTINIGSAYSAGFFIFIAGHKRIAYPLSSFLFHEGSAGSFGDAGKFKNFADFYKKELEMLKDIVLKYTAMTDEDYEKVRKDDYWLTADEAIELKICDTIATELEY